MLGEASGFGQSLMLRNGLDQAFMEKCGNRVNSVDLQAKRKYNTNEKKEK
jgi:hypothetical protein